MAQEVEQIKSRLGIVEVVSSYLKLEKAGINLRACCPFHNEKTPSFFVSPARQTYHCFGCQRGGDIFSFVQEIEGLDFVGTLKLLAERTGVVLATTNTRDRGEKERLLELLSAATDFYVSGLRDAPRDYLLQRGLRDETITSWHLGWAPDGWRHLYQFLKQKNFSDTEMERAGLVVKSVRSSDRDAAVYDRFRSRLMFPIADSSGRVVGFSGRIFGDETKNQVGGKYINTPETLLYNKSRLLYGYDQAKTAIRTAGEAILVEGQMDLLMSHQVGQANTVATSGTALTAEHLTLIKRLAPRVIMAFDGDLAGIRASQRAISLALTAGLEVKIALLPIDTDPADLIKQNSAAWAGAVKNSLPVIDFLLQTIATRTTDHRERSHLVQQEVYSYILSLPNQLDQAHYVNQVSEITGLESAVIRADLLRAKFIPPQTTPVIPRAEVVPNKLERLEESLLGLLFWKPELNDEPVRQILGSARFAARVEALTPRRETLIFMAEATWANVIHPETVMAELLERLAKELLRSELAETLAQLRMAEKSGDQAAMDEYLKKCQSISEQLHHH
ncbi:MAG: DNA primase [Patescibacteria group bacterium]